MEKSESLENSYARKIFSGMCLSCFESQRAIMLAIPVAYDLFDTLQTKIFKKEDHREETV